MFRVAALAGFAATSAIPGAALAMTQQGTQMMKNWAQADRCATQAQRQVPESTAEALAKRDQALQQCLANSILAPRAPLAPQSAPPR
jgi:hypothetical protein